MAASSVAMISSSGLGITSARMNLWKKRFYCIYLLAVMTRGSPKTISVKSLDSFFSLFEYYRLQPHLQLARPFLPQ